MRGLPDGYAETTAGDLYLADGMSPVVRWDGASASLLPVGVDPPPTACTLGKDPAVPDPAPAPPATACVLDKDAAVVPAAGTSTPIIGTYLAHVRFMNAAGVFSTLSPVSGSLVLSSGDAAFGLIYTDVPVAPPGVIRRQVLRNADGDTNRFYVDIDTSDLTSTVFTSSKYDVDLRKSASTFYVNGAAPSTTAGIVGVYTAYVRFVDETGAVSNLSPLSAELALTPTDYAWGIAYSAVPVAAQANVARRQILRNTAGQADVYYIDVDTDDLTSTTFSSSKFDTELSDQEPVPLFATDGTVLANSHGIPPTAKTSLAHHMGRMFLAVDRVYTAGSVVLTSGSASVTGLNTRWTASLAGRFLWIAGQPPLDILSVDVATQTLILTAPYAGTSDPYAAYAIRPAMAERRLVYYSTEEAQSWPPTQAIEIPEDGDELTGLMVLSSFLYILCARHLYRFTFQADPAVDGFVFLSANRGCVNDRCHVRAAGTAYMLDAAGIHSFNGSESKALSGPIQKLFTSESSMLWINWTAKDLFFATHQSDYFTIRWFVTLAGERKPRHAVCYDYEAGRFWIEDYDRPLTAGVEGVFEGRRRVFLGGPANATYLAHHWPLDGADDSTGDTRGTVSSAASFLLVDPVARWALYGLVGNSVTLVSGKGAGQRRMIHLVSGNALRLVTPWAVVPDRTTVYQIGGIPWFWRSGWLRLLEDEEEEDRKVEVLFEPTAHPATFTLRVFRDHAKSPVLWYHTRRASAAEGFAAVHGSADLVADMATVRGYVQQRLGGHKDLNAEGSRNISIELSGVSSRDFQTVYEVAVDAAKA